MFEMVDEYEQLTDRCSETIIAYQQDVMARLLERALSHSQMNYWHTDRGGEDAAQAAGCGCHHRRFKND
jgi:hypothetical protein